MYPFISRNYYIYKKKINYIAYIDTHNHNKRIAKEIYGTRFCVLYLRNA